jgi:hypothetical protein
MDSPDVMEQMPAGGGVNKPASGTYGEVADLNRLKSQLDVPETPGPGSGPPPGSGPSPGSGGGFPGGPPPKSPMPGTVPDVLMGPSTQPDTPMSTPLQGTGIPQATAMNGAQKRMKALIALSESPEADTETREWAKIVIEKLASRAS